VKEKTGYASAGGNPSLDTPAVEPFGATLEKHGLSLVRGEVHTLQLNTGFLCNLRCRHCHLEAGPARKEIMSRETMEEVIAFAHRIPFRTIDVTGGAPEMVPGLPFLIEGVAPLAARILLRSNLTAMAAPAREDLLALCIAKRVVLIVSLPSTNPSQTDAQRGAGVAEAGIAMLRRLNAAGYGVDGSGLELDIVSNPAGAFLPVPQAQAEKKFRQDLLRKWGITFSRLYTFGNVPLGRFRDWLMESGNYGRYVRNLAEGFNPCTVTGLMCRSQISVSWDGCLYDCDFNLAVGRPSGGRKTHVSELRRLPRAGSPIAVGDYCYACTAGSGFT
jgi:radical SAM/Cys-rich protein